MSMSSQDREVLALINHYLEQARSNSAAGRIAADIINDAYGNIVRDRNQPGATNDIITAADHYFVSRNMVGSGNFRRSMRETYGIDIPISDIDEAGMAATLVLGYDAVKTLARAIDDTSHYYFNSIPFFEPLMRSNPDTPTSIPTNLALRWSAIGIRHGRLDHQSPNRPINNLRLW